MRINLNQDMDKFDRIVSLGTKERFGAMSFFLHNSNIQSEEIYCPHSTTPNCKMITLSFPVRYVENQIHHNSAKLRILSHHHIHAVSYRLCYILDSPPPPFFFLFGFLNSPKCSIQTEDINSNDHTKNPVFGPL